MSTEAQARTPGWRLATVGGVPVYLGRTMPFLVVFILFTSLSSGGRTDPVGALVYGATLLISLLVSVLVHEGAHALAARGYGFRVFSVVADVWGGYTSYDAARIRAVQRAAIAAVGPISNLLLAGLAWALPFDWSGRGLFISLNVLLGLFNLLPGLPLDGGQIVAALVWRITGNRARGTIIAGWTGRVVALAVVAFSTWLALSSPGVDTVQLIIGLAVGWVLFAGASAGLRRGRFEHLVAGVPLETVLSPATVVSGDTPYGEVADRPGFVLALDGHGSPSLLMTPPQPPPPADTPVRAMSVQLPPSAVLPEHQVGDIEPLLRAANAEATPAVVVEAADGSARVATIGALDAAVTAHSAAN